MVIPLIENSQPPPKIEKPALQWAIPKELGIPADPLRARLDIHYQAAVITLFKDDVVLTKLVDIIDVAHALAGEMNFHSGLLPEHTLWWANTRGGPVTAIYVEPKVRRLTLQVDMKKVPERFTVPLPGLIFLCSPGKTPWVYAVKKKPTKVTDMVYNAPLANIFANGRSCPGSNDYPMRVGDIVEWFFVSFFTRAANLDKRSKRYPNDILQLWKFLDGKKKFPDDDLVELCKLQDIMALNFHD